MNCSRFKDVGALVLRVFVGATFVLHGVLKLQDMDNIVIFFGQIGFSPFFAYLVAYVEIVAGAALILGMFSFYACALLAIVMAVAAFKVKWGIPNVPFIQKYLLSELDLTLLASLVSIILTGPGRYSFFRLCKCHKTGVECKVCKVGGCQNSCDSEKEVA